MTTRRKALLLVGIVALLIAVLWLWRRQTPSMSRQQPSSEQVATGAGAPNLARTAASVEQPASQPTPAASAPAPTQKPSVELKRTFETLNHRPIEFYGRAVDQFGVAVSGADVTGSVIHNTGTASGRRLAHTTTDANGYFEFRALEGQSLGINLKKSGYEFNPRKTLFWYSYFEADHKRHQPDPRNPVVFTLWKKQETEPLVHYDKVWRFPANAGPVRINLVTGRIGGADADLVVTISRTPLQMRYGEQGFAWTAIVDVEGGGLIRAGQRDYYNVAPESGYVPRFEITQDAQNTRDVQDEKTKWTWREDFSDTFFVSGGNGKHFARVALRIRPNSDRKEGDNESLIAAEVWLNPNRSRNLEFDPSKVIATPR